MKQTTKKITSFFIIVAILLATFNIKIVKANTGKHMVSNCSKPVDGGLGDSTGEEYLIMDWYSKNWDYVYRYPDAKVAEKIAQLAVEAAQNDHIGYNNGDQRGTLWIELQANNYSPAAIKNDCASDCSGSAGMIVRAAGYQCNVDKLKEAPIYGPPAMPGNFEACGFQCLTGAEYTESPDKLQPGDVLCTVRSDHALIYIGDPDNIKVSGGGYYVGPGTKISECAYRSQWRLI